MGTVVVTGSSGSLGRRVVDLLLTDPDVERVVAIDVVAGRVTHPRVTSRTIDLARPSGDGAASLGASFDSASCVIHLAWSHQPGGANLDATRRVLEAAGKAGVEQFIYLSSATVYGAWPDNPVPLGEDVAIRPNPGFSFAMEKAEAERMALEWSDGQPGAALAVLRPAVTVGSPGPPLYRALAGTGTPWSHDAGRPVQFLHVDDLAAAVGLATRQRLHGVYNVSPDGWIGEGAARALAGGVPRVTLPGGLARTISSWGWRLFRTGTPPEALPYAMYPWVIANDRLVAAGWSPALSNEEALVTADDRVRWGDLPPARRRRLLMWSGLAGTAAVTGAALATGRALLRARRRRERP